MSFFKQAKEITAKIRQVQENLSIVILCSFFLNILSLALPLVVLQAYDRIIPNNGKGSLLILSSFVLGALISEMFLRYARSYLICWSAAQYEHSASTQAFDHLSKVSLEDYYNYGSNKILNHLSEVNKIRQFLSGQAIMTLVDLPFIFLYMGLIWYIAGIEIVLPLLVVLTTTFVVTLFLGNKIEHLATSKENFDTQSKTLLMDIFNNISTVRSQSIEKNLIQQNYFQQKRDNILSYNLSVLQNISQNNGALFSQVAVIIVVAAGAIKINSGEMGIGSLAACSILTGRIMQPIQKTLSLVSKFKLFILSHDKFYDLFQIKKTNTGNKDVPKLGKVFFNNVTKKLNNIEYLKNIKLSLSRGDTIHISFDNKVSKVSFLRLIMGTTHPTSGTILIDGQPPSKTNNEFIYNHVAYISSSNTVFKGTIWENVSSFNLSNKELVKKLCKDFDLDSIVNPLPKGYETVLKNSNSDTIADGVKVLICLIRSLASNPSIFVINSIESSLDNKTYDNFFKYLNKKKKDSVIILISGDMNFISLCDSYYTIKDSHIQNLEKQELYYA